MKILIIDDEKPALDELTYLISQFEGIEIIGSFTDPTKSLEFILLNEVEVVFIDISMPTMDGFTLAEAIHRLSNPPLIVFATAFNEYAVKAFEINAVDYLLKPISEERLLDTIERLRKKILLNSNDEKGINNIIKTNHENNENVKIPFWKNDRIYLVKPTDIIYCASIEGETKVICTSGEFYCKDTLSYFEDILNKHNYYRCHRSYLIGLDYINEIIPWFNNTYIIKFENIDEEIPVSRRNIKEFKKLLSIK